MQRIQPQNVRKLWWMLVMMTKLKKTSTWRRLGKGVEINSFGKSIFYYLGTSTKDSRKFFFDSFGVPRLLIHKCPLAIICVCKHWPVYSLGLKILSREQKGQTNNTGFPVGIFLFRVNNGNTKKCVKSIPG